MSKLINVLIAVEQPIAVKLKQNFTLVDPDDHTQGFVRNDLTNAQRKKLRTVLSGHWKGPNIQGTDYVILSMYLPNIPVNDGSDGEPEDLRLLWLEKFKELLPGQEFTLGAWDRTGAQYGTSIVPAVWDYTDPQNPVEVTPETIEGTPVYPIHSRIASNPELIFPDAVTYDANGNETSRTPATGPSEVNKLLGWEDRRWS